MLIASMTLGCPVAVDQLEDLEAGNEESGDETIGNGDSSGYVDPNPGLDWVVDGGGDELSKIEDSGETGDACGDFAVQVGEECDGWNTNFESCLSFGFVAGQLACHDDCTFDVSDCVAPGCGNGFIEGVELCDGTPYPCWMLGYAGSTDTNGMTPCEGDCTPSESACVAECEWGQPGCFCKVGTPCPDGYLCTPHPQNWENAPGTCKLAVCLNFGSSCVVSNNQPPCCAGLECVDSLCV